jgi:hypothetical protein
VNEAVKSFCKQAVQMERGGWAAKVSMFIAVFLTSVQTVQNDLG